MRAYTIIVLVKVLSHYGFVAGERLLEVRERIAGDAERCCLNVVRECVESATQSALMAALKGVRRTVRTEARSLPEVRVVASLGGSCQY